MRFGAAHSRGMVDGILFCCCCHVTQYTHTPACLTCACVCAAANTCACPSPPLPSGDHGSTFAGNPLVCATACSVFDKIAAPSFLGAVSDKGERLRAGLRAALTGNSHVKEVRESHSRAERQQSQGWVGTRTCWQHTRRQGPAPLLYSHEKRGQGSSSGGCRGWGWIWCWRACRHACGHQQG